ncbi:MAG TPA: DUF1735 domain-containing protein [Flavisolibacter sp.]|nr:DUF1735 domain-containing protein [Flavisolibacter sp.]
MKIKFKYSGIVMLASMLLATGCLKDKDVDDGTIGVKPDNSSKVVELQGPLDGLLTTALDAGARDTTISAVTVRLAAESVAENDIQVTLVLNPGLITEYNLNHGTSLQPLPVNLYSTPGLVVTIPKGSRMGYLKLTAKPNSLAGINYALGFSVASVSDPSVKISGNYSKQVVAIVVKNRFEGHYRAVGFFAHPTAPRSFNRDKYISTVDVNSCYIELGDLGIYAKLTVSPANTVTVSAGPGTSGTTAQVVELPGDPLYNNTYDPATRTFKLKYGYPIPGPTRIITEIVTRK